VKKLILAILLALIPMLFVQGGLKPGDPAAPFSLKSVDGIIVSLADYNNQRGVIMVFTSNLCPFSKAYEQRIIQLHRRFANMGFPVVAINSNSPVISPDDSFSQMKQLSDEKDYPFPYLKDENQEVCKIYGATRNPQIYLLEKSSSGFKVAYVGAIDNNSLDPRSASEHYVENAIIALLRGLRPEPSITKPIGCIIKNTN
jgi:peroxiredoxin